MNFASTSSLPATWSRAGYVFLALWLDFLLLRWHLPPLAWLLIMQWLSPPLTVSSLTALWGLGLLQDVLLGYPLGTLSIVYVVASTVYFAVKEALSAHIPLLEAVWLSGCLLCAWLLTAGLLWLCQSPLPMGALLLSSVHVLWLWPALGFLKRFM